MQVELDLSEMWPYSLWMQAINAFRLQPIHRTPSAYSATATEGKEKAEEERNKY